MSTALAVIETITPIDFFKPGASASILENLKVQVRAEAKGLDISRPQDREALRSLAAKVAKSKTGLDKAGKELVANQKAAIKLIDAERATVWDELEALQKEVRKPLTDWEDAENNRLADHEARIAAIELCGTDTAQNWQTLPLEEMEERFAALQTVNHNWQEFAERAKTVGYQAFIEIKDAIAKRRQYDKDQQDLVELRAAQAKREVEEREARIAQEAKEAAEAFARQREEERRAAAEEERLRIEAERAEAEARAKQAEALRVEAEEKAARDIEETAKRHREAIKAAEEKAGREQIAAEERLVAERERAERERQSADLRAESARQAAAELAEAELVAAVEEERQRAADEQRKAQEEATARESNRKHAAKINNEAKDALMKVLFDAGLETTISDVQATAIIVAIAKGLIPHTKISY